MHACMQVINRAQGICSVSDIIPKKLYGVFDISKCCEVTPSNPEGITYATASEGFM